jgi:histidinol-phosphate aminotransferase
LSIQEDEHFKETVAKVVATREWFAGELTRLGFTFPKSASNFIFASHKDIPAREIFEKAKEAKIFVRYFDKPRIDNHLRITIGTAEEMKRFVEFLERTFFGNK